MRNLRATDKRHCERVAISPVHIDGVANYAFPDKAGPFVKGDGPRIIGMHIEFDANKAGVERGFQSRVEKPRPEAAASIGRNNSHAEGSAMGVRGEEMPSNVAPPNDLAFSQSNELRVAAFDGAQHEFASLWQRRRFEKGEIFPLTRDRVERAMKALDVFGRYRRHAHFRLNVKLLRRCHASIMTNMLRGAYGAQLPFARLS